ncbi:MAG: NAAT family transporter [Bacteroidales bacterium]|nr:NAAT family transporter [Bacteroidales bacterium]
MTFVTTLLLYFTSFFTLMNPLGAMPVFLSMTDGLTQKQRKNTAMKTMLTAFLVLTLFAILGKYVFDFFHISINGLRVVGGVLFFVMGYDMLNAKISRMKMTTEEEAQTYTDDVALTPLGVPLIAGPGSITNAMVLMGDANSLADKGLVLLSILLVSVVSFIILLGATGIIKVIGSQGTKIFTKLMGLIVMIIAVEFFFAGITPYVQTMLH